MIGRLVEAGMHHAETVIHLSEGEGDPEGRWRGTITVGPRTGAYRLSVEGEDEETVRAAAQRLEEAMTRP